MVINGTGNFIIVIRKYEQIAEMERSSGSTDLLQRQLLDAKEKLQVSERAVQQKQEVEYCSYFYFIIISTTYNTES